MIIKRNMLSLVGKNKVEQETDWVNKKGDQGYRFKLLPKQKDE